jgi:hypothetical protein
MKSTAVLMPMLLLVLSACSAREPDAAPAAVASAPPAPSTPAPAAPAPTADVSAVEAPTLAAPATTAAAEATEAPTPAELTPLERAQTELNAAAGAGVALAVSKASDAQAHAYAAMLAQVTGQMLASDAGACGRLLLPQSFGPIGWEEFPPTLQRPFMQLQQEIIASARSQPTVPPTEDEAGALFDAIHDRLAAEHGADALAGVQGELGAAQTCRAWHLYYTGIAASPPAQGGRVMRWLNAP